MILEAFVEQLERLNAVNRKVESRADAFARRNLIAARELSLLRQLQPFGGVAPGGQPVTT